MVNISVSRDGEPVLKRGPSAGSVKQQNQYTIGTTPIPAGAYGVDWLGLFNSRFTGQTLIPGMHDGSKITVDCWPDDEAEMVEKVDSAIEYANERLKELYG